MPNQVEAAVEDRSDAESPPDPEKWERENKKLNTYEKVGKNG
jgi:hypothetical protein